MTVILIECFLCARHCAHRFTFSISFNLHNCPMRQELLFPFYRQGNWLLKALRLLSCRGRIWTQVCESARQGSLKHWIKTLRWERELENLEDDKKCILLQRNWMILLVEVQTSIISSRDSWANTFVPLNIRKRDIVKSKLSKSSCYYKIKDKTL